MSVYLYLASALVILLVVYFLWNIFSLYKNKSNKNYTKEIITLHYAPWCGHCKHFMPEFDKFTLEAKDKYNNLDVVKLDCTATKCPDTIRGYPTVILSKNGKEIEYHGPRTSSGLCDFIDSV